MSSVLVINVNMDSNQYAIELITYLLVLAAYFDELIVYMLSVKML